MTALKKSAPNMARFYRLGESDDLYAQIKQKMSEVEVSSNECNIKQMYIIQNSKLDRRFFLKRSELEKETNTRCLIGEGFHGTPCARTIADEGFNVSLSHWGLLGKGVYLTPQAEKANRFVFGRGQGCPRHNDQSCSTCTRRMLWCVCLMGRIYETAKPKYFLPSGYHSAILDPSKRVRDTPPGDLSVIISAAHGDQVLPYVLIEYNLKATLILPPQMALLRALQTAPKPVEIRVVQPVANEDCVLQATNWQPNNPPALEARRLDDGKVHTTCMATHSQLLPTLDPEQGQTVDKPPVDPTQVKETVLNRGTSRSPDEQLIGAVLDGRTGQSSPCVEEQDESGCWGFLRPLCQSLWKFVVATAGCCM